MSECVYMCRVVGRRGAAVGGAAVFFVGSAAFAAVGLNNQLRRLFFLTAMLLLVISFLIVKRFLATGYSYAIYADRDRGYADIVIYEHTLAYREPRTVCRVGLASVRSVEVFDRSRESRKRGRAALRDTDDGRFDNYCVDLFSRRFCLVRYTECGERGALKLAVDEGFIEVIKKYTI